MRFCTALVLLYQRLQLLCALVCWLLVPLGIQRALPARAQPLCGCGAVKVCSAPRSFCTAVHVHIDAHRACKMQLCTHAHVHHTDTSRLTTCANNTIFCRAAALMRSSCCLCTSVRRPCIVVVLPWGLCDRAPSTVLCCNVCGRVAEESFSEHMLPHLQSSYCTFSQSC